MGNVLHCVAVIGEVNITTLSWSTGTGGRIVLCCLNVIVFPMVRSTGKVVGTSLLKYSDYSTKRCGFSCSYV